MKDQAKELMSQMDVFVVNASEGHAPARTAAPSVRTAAKPAVAVTKPGVKKPSVSAKPAQTKQPVGAAAGNGHDRHKKDDDFEEF